MISRKTWESLFLHDGASRSWEGNKSTHWCTVIHGEKTSTPQTSFSDNALCNNPVQEHGSRINAGPYCYVLTSPHIWWALSYSTALSTVVRVLIISSFMILISASSSCSVRCDLCSSWFCTCTQTQIPFLNVTAITLAKTSLDWTKLPSSHFQIKPHTFFLSNKALNARHLTRV